MELSAKINATAAAENLDGMKLIGINAADAYKRFPIALFDARFQAKSAKLDAITALANAAGVLANNGSGSFSYLATTDAPEDTPDAGKLVKTDIIGGITGYLLKGFDPESDRFAALQNGLAVFRSAAGGTTTLSREENGSAALLTLPTENGTLLSDASALNPHKLAQSGATNGQALVWSEDNSRFEPGTVSGGGGVSDGDKGDIVVTDTGATWTIENNAITTAKIADTAITTAKIADTAITDAKLAGSITPSKITGTAAVLGANTFTDGQTIAQTAANAAALLISGHSLTGSNAQSLLDLSGTWNTSGTPSAIKLNITDTASNASALLMQLQTGGTNRFIVTKTGLCTIGSAAIASAGTVLNLVSSFGTSTLSVGGGGSLNLSAGLSAGGTISSNIFSIGETEIQRDSAYVNSFRRGTNAIQLNVNNTFTSTTNFERATMDWRTTTGLFRFGTEKGSGGGSARPMAFITDGTARINIGAAGELGFFGASAIAKPTVTGSRGANDALASLLTALASLGLLTDSSS
jgi:hypothetical protein